MAVAPGAGDRPRVPEPGRASRTSGGRSDATSRCVRCSWWWCRAVFGAALRRRHLRAGAHRGQGDREPARRHRQPPQPVRGRSAAGVRAVGAPARAGRRCSRSRWCSGSGSRRSTRSRSRASDPSTHRAYYQPLLTLSRLPAAHLRPGRDPDHVPPLGGGVRRARSSRSPAGGSATSTTHTTASSTTARSTATSYETWLSENGVEVRRAARREARLVVDDRGEAARERAAVPRTRVAQRALAGVAIRVTTTAWSTARPDSCRSVPTRSPSQ